MEVPTTLPGTDIAGYLIDVKTGKQLEVAPPRTIAHGWWVLTDCRPGAMERAARAGYRYVSLPPRWEQGPTRTFMSMWGDKPPAYHTVHRLEQQPDPVTVTPDARHTRNYASAAIAAYMEAEIAKELAKHEREVNSRKYQAKVRDDASYRSRSIALGHPPVSATCYDMGSEGISQEGWEWHAHPGGADACELNTPVFVDAKGWRWPMREHNLCKGYRTAEDAVAEARRRKRYAAVKNVA